MSKPSPKDAQQMGLMVIDRQSYHELQQRGIEAETVGLQRMSNGAALITLEVNQAIKLKIQQKILESDDGEEIACLTSALANLEKGESTTIRALSVGQQVEAKPKAARKSFAPKAPIDVTSQIKSAA